MKAAYFVIGGLLVAGAVVLSRKTPVKARESPSLSRQGVNDGSRPQMAQNAPEIARIDASGGYPDIVRRALQAGQEGGEVWSDGLNRRNYSLRKELRRLAGDQASQARRLLRDRGVSSSDPAYTVFREMEKETRSLIDRVLAQVQAGKPVAVVA